MDGSSVDEPGDGGPWSCVGLTLNAHIFLVMAPVRTRCVHNHTHTSTKQSQTADSAPDVATCGVTLSTRHDIRMDIMCKHDVILAGYLQDGRSGIPSQPRGPADISPEIDPSSLPVLVPV